MKRSAIITSIRSTAMYHTKLLERYVNSNPPGMPPERPHNAVRAYFSPNYQHIDVCFARIPVKGMLEIDMIKGFFGQTVKVKVPVSSAFLVTCTKSGNDIYRSTWNCSLS